MSIVMPRSTYAKPETRLHFFDQTLASMQSMPEIQNAALSSALPLRGQQSSVLSVQGRPDPTATSGVHDIGTAAVSPGYFQTLGLALEQGRVFDSRDNPGAPAVAIVNQALARKYFPSENPLGKQIRFFGDPEATNPWLAIIGVAATEKRSTLAEMTWLDPPMVYRPMAQKPSGGAQLILRTAAEQSRVGAAVQQKIAALDPNIPITNIDTFQHIASSFAAYPRFRAVLLGVFAGIALLLAIIGLYGVLSQLVAQRTHEIGVRMALGAQRRDVLVMVVREGMLLALIGVALGLGATWWLTKFITSLLYGVTATDFATLAAGSAVLIAAAFFATYLPALNATKVQPTVALRHE
jgi:putative ABC transport system permease protein